MSNSRKVRHKRKVHPHGPGTFTGSYEHPALTPLMDSVLTLPLAEAVREAAAAPGDFIDTGLVLIRVLREKGFEVRLSEVSEQ